MHGGGSPAKVMPKLDIKSVVLGMMLAQWWGEI